MTDTEHVVAASVVAVFGLLIFAWANWWPTKSKRDKISTAPSYSQYHNSVTYDFFVGHDLATFMSSVDDGLFDFLHVDETDSDGTLAGHVIVVVTVENWVGRPEFVTQFRMLQGVSVKNSWHPAGGRLWGEAMGLFVLPGVVTAASTEIIT
ncbi:hypothetical protein CA54_04260 [Symmachiella macrocystis]|uniref:Uncharacterized protein n=1 Tax=Symmachiella macrocystis TaxID=2527985 RepID=A0A5C6BHT9_9PLAN|nr:hypothetical protein [Symmachiella macrocystis]TWU11618.1 hypothetical protein CA54_04260 [Symmachiella macrocystis]